MKNFDKFVYFVNERQEIWARKESGQPKPWSEDPVFQTTYFCNVRRQDDPGTRAVMQWLREEAPVIYNEERISSWTVFNTIMARCINNRHVIPELPFYDGDDADQIRRDLQYIEQKMHKRGLKLWGNAYIFSTAGQAIPKLDYLVDVVLESARQSTQWMYGADCSLAFESKRLQQIHGISTFMAGQVIADVKHLDLHPLHRAPDHWDFCVPGPGSLRGASWVLYGSDNGVSPGQFLGFIDKLRSKLAEVQRFPFIDNQDLQNCLCEFDKYMRVSTGTGRSKRSYDAR